MATYLTHEQSRVITVKSRDSHADSRRTSLTEKDTRRRVVQRSGTVPSVVEGSVTVLEQLPVMWIHDCGLCVCVSKEFVIIELWPPDHAQL